MSKFFVLLILIIYANAVQAFEAANPYWLSIKPKLQKHLEGTIDKNLYQYEILGPVVEMKNFLGNRPDVEIKFEKLNLAGPSEQKSIVAVAYNSDGSKADSLIINLKVQRYKDVLVVKNPIKQGTAITAENLYKKKILADSLDERLYFTGDLNQKFASINIPAETILKSNMINHEKLIKTGDSLKVSSGSKLINLEFSCRAAGSGDLGDSVSLVCPDIERKNLKAIITGLGTARLN